MALLKIMTGEMKGRKFEIDRDRVVIGRSSDNLIALDDPSISGRHCAVLRDGRSYTLRDLKSTNGTILNGATITEYRLSPGDTITVGAIALMFDGDDVEPVGANEVPPTIASKPATARTTAQTATTNGASPFGVRHTSQWHWLVMAAAIGLLLLAATTWYIFQLFKN